MAPSRCRLLLLLPCSTAASTKYTGPVPLVPHVHGSQGVRDDSDGYTEAWFMPDAVNGANFAQVCQQRIQFCVVCAV